MTKARKRTGPAIEPDMDDVVEAIYRYCQEQNIGLGELNMRDAAVASEITRLAVKVKMIRRYGRTE